MNHPDDPRGSFSATRSCKSCGGIQHKEQAVTGRDALGGLDKIRIAWTCQTCGHVDRLVGVQGWDIVTGDVPPKE